MMDVGTEDEEEEAGRAHDTSKILDAPRRNLRWFDPAICTRKYMPHFMFEVCTRYVVRLEEFEQVQQLHVDLVHLLTSPSG